MLPILKLSQHIIKSAEKDVLMGAHQKLSYLVLFEI